MSDELSPEVVYIFMGKSSKIGNVAITANAVLSSTRRENGLLIVHMQLTDPDFRMRAEPVVGSTENGFWVPQVEKNQLSITLPLGRFTIDQAYFLGYNDGVDLSSLNDKADLGMLV